MLNKRKPKISEVLHELNTLPIENPFGCVDVEPVVRKKRKKKDDPLVPTVADVKPLSGAVRELKLENEMFDEEDAFRRKVKRLMKSKGYTERKAIRVLLKREQKKSETLMFPEKTNCEMPQPSKLTSPTREVRKMQDKLTNVIRVPKDQLDTFMKVFNNSSKNLSSEFLSSVAPVFLAFEDAMNYATVALRDGLSYDGEIDLELAPLLEWSARLNTLELYLKGLTSMTTPTRDRIMRHATIRAVEKAFLVKNQVGNLSGANNKVAGIVTPLAKTSDTGKIKKAYDAVKNLKRAATTVKDSPSNIAPVVGALKKRYRT